MVFRREVKNRIRFLVLIPLAQVDSPDKEAVRPGHAGTEAAACNKQERQLMYYPDIEN